jgi:long-chain acyl-CoA synthetase
MDTFGGYLAPVLLTALSLPVVSYLLYSQPKEKDVTIRVPNNRPGESCLVRHVLAAKGLLATPGENVRTAYDILMQANKAYGTKNALGYRKVIRVHEEKKDIVKTVAGKTITETKLWRFLELGSYTWFTYKEIFQKSQLIGAGLAHLGFGPGDRACIYAGTWYIAFFLRLSV